MFPHIREDDLKDVYQDNFLDLDATVTEILNKSSAGNVNNCFYTFTPMSAMTQILPWLRLEEVISYHTSKTKLLKTY